MFLGFALFPFPFSLWSFPFLGPRRVSHVFFCQCQFSLSVFNNFSVIIDFPLGVFLEQHLLLNRRNEVTDEFHIKYVDIVKKSCIYICTTMYREIEQEMEQLLNSLHDIDCARQKSKRQIESHIFFDGAIKGDILNNFVLQLISLIPRTLKVKIEACMKIKTPYGMQMRWKLPGGMYFHVHLKDNLKVRIFLTKTNPMSRHLLIPTSQQGLFVNN